MAFQLILTVEYRSDTEWRWVLSDPAGRFLEDHEVRLSPNDPEERPTVTQRFK